MVVLYHFEIGKSFEEATSIQYTIFDINTYKFLKWITNIKLDFQLVS